jgi:enoyl-CoA hydratase/carnithine racemase
VVVTLAQGDAGNRLTIEGVARLSSLLDEAEASGKRWVMLDQRGADFCLGRAPGALSNAQREVLLDLVERLQSTKLITIVAATGGCAGFGVGLVALADISIITAGSWLQFPEVLGGSAPAIVATWLFDLVPYKQALYWMITGEVISAADARSFGLVTTVVAPQDLASAADAEARRVETMSGEVTAKVKSVARAMRRADPDLTVRRAMALKWFS